MLIVAGTIDVAPGDRDRFLAERAEQVATTREERGCLEYVFSLDPEDPGRVRLFERWTDDDALAAHLAALAAKGPPRKGSVAAVARAIERYQISAVQSLA